MSRARRFIADGNTCRCGDPECSADPRECQAARDAYDDYLANEMFDYRRDRDEDPDYERSER